MRSLSVITTEAPASNATCNSGKKSLRCWRSNRRAAFSRTHAVVLGFAASHCLHLRTAEESKQHAAQRQDKGAKKRKR
jgi:hypothetical protein